MSSRILQGAEVKLAEPLLWRSVPNEAGVGAAEPEVADAPAPPETPPPAPSPPPTPPPPPPAPSGPSWEEFKALEKRYRELEGRLPVVEREGREAGRKEGEAAAMAKWESAMEQMARSVEQMAGLRARLRREAEQDVVQLSMAIARRVLRRELSVDPEALVGLVRTAFERVEAREVQSIRVRGEDAVRLGEFLSRIGGPARIEVTPDASLEPGAVILETQRGSLDASIHVQLEEIERGFADRLSRRKESNAG
ncbi:MAG: FliH/SctL family protein [Bryobacteraceae bacterium]|nr:FliH/SctL family protein [Bryobacteraceae bacterium]